MIEDGDTLVPKLMYERLDGWSSQAQSSIILPFSAGKYRVITPAASDSQFLEWYKPGAVSTPFDLILYHEVDMNANSGAGKVTKRMVPLLQGVKLSRTQTMACRHGDGKSWWLLKQASDTNLVYKFLFTEDSVYGPYLQGFAEPHFDDWDYGGQSMFSKDGTRYATTAQYGHKIFVADFDRCSGRLSNPKVYEVPAPFTQNPYDSTERDSVTNGLAFSPNGRFLYVSGFNNVQQLDLQDNNMATAWATIAGIDTTWDWFQLYSNIYPGPGDKLYIGNWHGLGGQMSVINRPDNKGSASDFCRKCLRFPGYVFQGLTYFAGVGSPPCMPDYRLGAASPICYPTGVPTPAAATVFTLYPNPANERVMLRFPSKYVEAGECSLFDITGRRVATASFNGYSGTVEIDVRHLPSGLYHYRVTHNGVAKASGKFIKQ